MCSLIFLAFFLEKKCLRILKNWHGVDSFFFLLFTNFCWSHDDIDAKMLRGCGIGLTSYIVKLMDIIGESGGCKPPNEKPRR